METKLGVEEIDPKAVVRCDKYNDLYRYQCPHCSERLPDRFYATLDEIGGVGV